MSVVVWLSPVAVRRLAQLAILTLAAMVASYARMMLGPLQESVRLSLSLTDNQIALLQGPAMAVPLLIAAIPLGIAVDRFCRARILLIATAVTLLGCVLSAFAMSFTTLLIARALVGIAGPATAVATYSLLADLFSSTQRGRVTMVIVLSQAGASSIAFALGGMLLAVLGPQEWRSALLWMTSALLPILLLLFFLREPARTGQRVEQPTLRKTLPELWEYRGVIVTLLAGMAIVNLADGAALIWAAPTLARGFNLSPDNIGAIMATVLLIGGIAGPIAGGFLADFCQRAGGPRLTVSVLGVLVFLSIPTCFFATVSTASLATILLVLFITLGTAINVMTTAVAIVVIPNELRGLCVSLKTAAAVVFGLGIAPLTVSVLSGMMGGPSRIGEALALVCAITSTLGAITFALGRRCFTGRPLSVGAT